MKSLLIITSLFVGMNSFAQDVVNYTCKLRYEEYHRPEDAPSFSKIDEATFTIALPNSEIFEAIHADPILFKNTETAVDVSFDLSNLQRKQGVIQASVFIEDQDGYYPVALSGEFEMGKTIFMGTLNRNNFLRFTCKVQ